MNKITIQELINHGMVNLKDYKNGLYYLEFMYADRLNGNTEYWETDFRIGNIICDINGLIYRATMLGYASPKRTSIITVFPQIISKSDNININDIYKIDENNHYYINVVLLRDHRSESSGSKIWTIFCKENNSEESKFLFKKLTRANVSTKDYFFGEREMPHLSEHFKREYEMFKLITSDVYRNVNSVINEHNIN